MSGKPSTKAGQLQGPEWVACFPNHQPGAPIIGDPLSGVALSIFRDNKSGTATLGAGMPAFGNDGTTEIRYALNLFGGSFSPGPWVPFSKDTFTEVTFDVDTDWRMRVEGKGGKKLACTGSGILTSSVTFIVKSITDPF